MSKAKLEKIACPFELKSIDTDGSFEGYGSVFGVLDNFGDIVEQGAFKRSLNEAHKKGRLPALLWQHQTDKPIGRFLEIKEDTRGLFVRGKFTRGVAQADEARRLLKDGALDGLSIGFSVNPGGATVDRKAGVRRLTDLKLMEVSLVTFPANEEARISAVKSCDPKFVERTLRDAGLSRHDAKRIVSRGVTTAKALRDADADAVKQMATTLRERTVELNHVCQKEHADGITNRGAESKLRHAH